MTKKIIGAFVALALLLGLVAIPFVFASQVEFAVSSVTAEAGDEVEIEVSITNNPGIAGFIMTLEYDNELLAFDEESFTATDLIDDGKVETNFNEPDSDIDFIQVVWYSADNFTADGVVFTMTFTVSEDAPVGAIPITLTVEAINEDLDELDITTVDGEVLVLGPTEEPTEEPTETPGETEEPTPTPGETEEPTDGPTEEPTEEPTDGPTEEPTETPGTGGFDGDKNKDGWVDIDDLIWLVDTARYTNADDVFSLLDSDIFNKTAE